MVFKCASVDLVILFLRTFSTKMRVHVFKGRKVLNMLNDFFFFFFFFFFCNVFSLTLTLNLIPNLDVKEHNEGQNSAKFITEAYGK